MHKRLPTRDPRLRDGKYPRAMYIWHKVVLGVWTEMHEWSVGSQSKYQHINVC